MKNLVYILLALVALPGVQSAALAQANINAISPVTDQVLTNPPTGDWPSYGRDFSNYRYSPLQQITKGNVDKLTLVWARALEPGNMEAAPLEHDGVMFVPNPRDVIQAIDAVTGKLIWEYRRKLPDPSTLNAVAELKRGVALYGDKLYFVSWDNFVVALDAKTGRLVWETDRGGAAEGASNSTGPIVAGGVVVAGTTCQYAEFGCYVTGHDAVTGKELWRNMLIPRPGEVGDDTWGKSDFKKRWITAAWGQMLYDPVLDLIYYGSSGAGPASEVQRGTEGGSMYGTNTRFAVKPKTGEIVWRHQVLPRDNWDQECTFEMYPVDIDVNPSPDMDGLMAINPNVHGTRRVLTGVPCKTGIMWQFDAKTGEFIYARSTVEQNLIKSIDKTGLVTINEAALPIKVGVKTPICPTVLGGRNWAPGAFNPKSRVMFMTLTNMCANIAPMDQKPTGLDHYNIDVEYVLPKGTVNAGRIDAIDVVTGKTLWSYTQKAPQYAPITATASGLLFTGGMDRKFKAIDQKTGKVLWTTTLGSRASGHPITYEVGGRQYVAIPAGGPTFADEMLTASGADVDGVSGGNMMYVFALPSRK